MARDKFLTRVESSRGTLQFRLQRWNISHGFQQGITNTLALPIDKMLYIHPPTILSDLNNLNTFTKETGSPHVKLVLIR